MPQKKRTKKTVHYEIRYKCLYIYNDRPPFTPETCRESLKSKTANAALATFKSYKRLFSEFCNGFKLIRITRTVETCPKKKIIVFTEELIGS